MDDALAQPRSADIAAHERLIRLSDAAIGDRGRIVEVRVQSHPDGHGVDVAELERRLLEFGFVEDAEIEVLHEGAIKRDPIAVRLGDMRVALRRRDAEDVWVMLGDVAR